jgi:hypothetical protein
MMPTTPWGAVGRQDESLRLREHACGFPADARRHLELDTDLRGDRPRLATGDLRDVCRMALEQIRGLAEDRRTGRTRHGHPRPLRPPRRIRGTAHFRGTGQPHVEKHLAARRLPDRVLQRSFDPSVEEQLLFELRCIEERHVVIQSACTGFPLS